MSDNPLLIPAREVVVELWPGDVERQFFDLETEMNEEQALADRAQTEWEQSPDTRMSSKRPANEHAKKADELAKRIDALVAEVEPVRLVLRAPKAREVRQLRDDHPPRKGNKEDEAQGVNPATFYPALGFRCVVSPEVDEAQWAEFVDDCSEFNWRKITAAIDGLCSTEVSVPKFSAVSVLTQYRQQESRRRLASVQARDGSTAGSR